MQTTSQTVIHTAIPTATQRVNQPLQQQAAADAPAPRLTAIILAGGRSSRMGQDKAMLQIAGETQLQRTVALAIAVGCEQILVSRNQPGFIEDVYPEAGPLAGIQAALLHATASQCLVLAIDTPLLNPEVLMPLLTHPCSCFAGSPLPALIPNNSAVRHWLAQQLQQRSQAKRQLSVAGFLTHLAVTQLDCPSPEALFNSNTPAQWQQAVQQLQTQAPSTEQAPSTKQAQTPSAATTAQATAVDAFSAEIPAKFLGEISRAFSGALLGA